MMKPDSVQQTSVTTNFMITLFTNRYIIKTLNILKVTLMGNFVYAFTHV